MRTIIIFLTLTTTCSAARIIGVSPAQPSRRYASRTTEIRVSRAEYDRLRRTMGGQRPDIRFGGRSGVRRKSRRSDGQNINTPPWQKRGKYNINTPPQWKYPKQKKRNKPNKGYQRWEYKPHKYERHEYKRH